MEDIEALTDDNKYICEGNKYICEDFPHIKKEEFKRDNTVN